MKYLNSTKVKFIRIHVLIYCSHFVNLYICFFLAQMNDPTDRPGMLPHTISAACGIKRYEIHITLHD